MPPWQRLLPPDAHCLSLPAYSQAETREPRASRTAPTRAHEISQPLAFPRVVSPRSRQQHTWNYRPEPRHRAGRTLQRRFVLQLSQLQHGQFFARLPLQLIDGLPQVAELRPPPQPLPASRRPALVLATQPRITQPQHETRQMPELQPPCVPYHLLLHPKQPGVHEQLPQPLTPRLPSLWTAAWLHHQLQPRLWHLQLSQLL